MATATRPTHQETSMEITITARAASEPGALPHFAGNCPACGIKVSNAFRFNAEADAARHIAWHATRRGGR
jgi:hypothetical protein